MKAPISFSTVATSPASFQIDWHRPKKEKKNLEINSVTRHRRTKHVSRIDEGKSKRRDKLNPSPRERKRRKFPAAAAALYLRLSSARPAYIDTNTHTRKTSSPTRAHSFSVRRKINNKKKRPGNSFLPNHPVDVVNVRPFSPEMKKKKKLINSHSFYILFRPHSTRREMHCNL
jgi:hypothetical protein